MADKKWNVRSVLVLICTGIDIGHFWVQLVLIIALKAGRVEHCVAAVIVSNSFQNCLNASST